MTDHDTQLSELIQAVATAGRVATDAERDLKESILRWAATLIRATYAHAETAVIDVAWQGEDGGHYPTAHLVDLKDECDSIAIDNRFIDLGVTLGDWLPEYVGAARLDTGLHFIDLLDALRTADSTPVQPVAAVSRETLEQHLMIQHGYRDQVDDSPEDVVKPGAYGIVRLDHTVWSLDSLHDLHDLDHEHNYPETGTPVKGWAHRHVVRLVRP